MRTPLIIAGLTLLTAGCIDAPSGQAPADGGTSPDAAAPDAGLPGDASNPPNPDATTTDSGCRPSSWRAQVLLPSGDTPDGDSTIPVPLLLKTASDVMAVANDADVVWFAGEDGLPIPHEIVRAQPTAGDVEAWFEWGSGTPVYMYVGVPESRAPIPAMWQNYAGVWHFSNSSRTRVVDSSPNGNAGKAPSGFALGSGYLGVGVEFSGTQHVAVPDAASLRIDEYSIYAWVQPRAPLADAGLVMKVLQTGATPRPSYGYAFRLGGTLAGFGTPNDSDTYSTFRNDAQSILVEPRAWHHLVYTRSLDSGVTLFINGEIVHEQAFNQPLGFDDGPLLIGASFNGSIDQQLKGRIDEVMIEVGERPAADVAKIYRAQHADTLAQLGAFEPVGDDCE